jgi:hypothetical protein
MTGLRRDIGLECGGPAAAGCDIAFEKVRKSGAARALRLYLSPHSKKNYSPFSSISCFSDAETKVKL